MIIWKYKVKKNEVVQNLLENLKIVVISNYLINV